MSRSKIGEMNNHNLKMVEEEYGITAHELSMALANNIIADSHGVIDHKQKEIVIEGKKKTIRLEYIGGFSASGFPKSSKKSCDNNGFLAGIMGFVLGAAFFGGDD